MLSEGIIDRDPSCNIKKLKEPKREKPVLGLDDVTKLLDACPEKTFRGVRNRAIIRLMWDCGLRRNEVSSALLEDLNLKETRLGVIGKGNKFAWVTLSSTTIKALELWLKKRHRHKSPYIFIGKNGNPLSSSWVTHMIIKLGKSVGLSVYPHLIRHSVVTWLAEQGMNPFDLQAFARHEDISITMKYVNSARIRQRLPAEIRRFSPGNKV
jgi:integrase/recombinase XerD